MLAVFGIVQQFAVVMLLSTQVDTDSSCQLKADVVFIVDSSRSIWPPHYDIELDFLANITQGLNVGPDSTHVGVISFSDGARVDLYLNDLIEDVSELQAKIRSIPFMMGGKTETYEALRLACEQVFSPANGARSDVPRIIIIVTDGDSSNRQLTKQQADVIREENILVFVIGIGHSIDPEQLAEIATDQTSTYVHSVSSFNTLNTVLPVILPATCQATTSVPKMTEQWSPATTYPISETEEPMFSDQTKQVCHSKKADVVFVLDKSSSITYEHFRTQLNFVSDVMNVFNVDRDHTHVGVVTFDYEPKLEFGLLRYFSKSEVRQAILSIEYTAGSTNTFRALELVTKHVLTPEGGARGEVARVVIVVTDGKSSDEESTKYWAGQLKKTGAYVFAIGVGSDTDKEELVGIGSQPARDFVFEVDGYNALNTIQDILAFRACEVPSGDLFVRCQQSQKPADVMFVTEFSHAGGRDVNRTTRLIKEVSGGIMSEEGHVRVGLVSSECPDVADVKLDRASNAEEFARAVTSSAGRGLAPVLSRAREQLTVVQEGARRGVKRLAVVFVHGPISDLKASAREVMRAKSAANRPGVQFVFVGIGEGAQERQLVQLASEKNPDDISLLMEKVGKEDISWQDVLTKVCEALES